jgi:energy-coupling factor transporter ATP-binding protein EcfA2
MSSEDFPLKLEGDDVPMVHFDRVTKRYGDLTVLDSLNLDVKANEMVAIIGPSGSGKTTVMRMLMALELIDDGGIYVDGKPMTHMEKDGRLVRANKSYLSALRCLAQYGGGIYRDQSASHARWTAGGMAYPNDVLLFEQGCVRCEPTGGYGSGNSPDRCRHLRPPPFGGVAVGGNHESVQPFVQ